MRASCSLGGKGRHASLSLSHTHTLQVQAVRNVEQVGAAGARARRGMGGRVGGRGKQRVGEGSLPFPPCFLTSAMLSPPRLSAATPPLAHPLAPTAAASSITPAHRASLASLAEASLGAPLAPGVVDALVDLLGSGCAPGSVSAVLGAVCRGASAGR